MVPANGTGKFNKFKNRKTQNGTPPEQAPAPAPAAAPAPEQPPNNPPPDPTSDAHKTETFAPKPTATVELQNSVTSEAPAPVQPNIPNIPQPPPAPPRRQPPAPRQVVVGDCEACPITGPCGVEGPSDCAKLILNAGHHPIDAPDDQSVQEQDPVPRQQDQPVTTTGPSPEPIIPQSTAMTAPQRGEQTGVAAPSRGGALLRVDPRWGFPEEEGDRPFAGMCDPTVDKAMGVSIARRSPEYHYGREGEKRRAAGSQRGWFYDSLTGASKERMNVVLLHERFVRSYRQKLKPDTDPVPAYCFSDDGLTRDGGTSPIQQLQVAENQGCATCQYAKWRKDSSGKKLPPKCSEAIGMLCFDLDDMIPFTMRLHGINLGPWRKSRAELKISAIKFGQKLDLGIPASYAQLYCAFTVYTVPEGIAYLINYGDWRPIDPKMAGALVDNYHGMKQPFYDTDFAFSVVDDVILDDSELGSGDDYQGAPPPQYPPQQYQQNGHVPPPPTQQQGYQQPPQYGGQGHQPPQQQPQQYGGQQPPNYPPGYQDGQFNRGGGGQ